MEAAPNSKIARAFVVRRFVARLNAILTISRARSHDRLRVIEHHLDVIKCADRILDLLRGNLCGLSVMIPNSIA